MRTRLTKKAAGYLRFEAHYLRLRSPRAASDFVNAIREARKNLGKFPNLGSKSKAIPVPGSRTLVVGDYLLDYVQTSDLIEIVTIRHGRQPVLTPELEIDDDLEDEPEPSGTRP